MPSGFPRREADGEGACAGSTTRRPSLHCRGRGASGFALCDRTAVSETSIEACGARKFSLKIICQVFAGVITFLAGSFYWVVAPALQSRPCPRELPDSGRDRDGVRSAAARSSGRSIRECVLPRHSTRNASGRGASPIPAGDFHEGLACRGSVAAEKKLPGAGG